MASVTAKLRAPSIVLAAGGTGGHLFPAFALAQELARRAIAVDLVTDQRGDLDGAIPQMRAAIDDLFHAGYLSYAVVATSVLVETLLERGAGGDVAEAAAAIDRSAAAPIDEGLALHEMWRLRPRALLARARADANAYRDYRDRYRAIATSLGFEGHMKWAEAMA